MPGSGEKRGVKCWVRNSVGDWPSVIGAHAWRDDGVLSRGDAGAVLSRSAWAALDTLKRSAAAGSAAGIACTDRADCADRADGMSGCTALA
jgi:hypothetical protein